ncbi:hypothetical protein [Lysobacter tyrosinilyticus]
MNIKLAGLAVILTIASAPALAGKPTSVEEVVVSKGAPLQVNQIAFEAGVSPDDVRMVLGANTPHARFRTCYEEKVALVGAAIERLDLAQQNARSSARVASINTP